MVYKKYIKKRGKLHGPYYYESYRENGKVKHRYLGTKLPGRRKSFVPIFVAALVILVIFGLVYFRVTGRNVTEDLGESAEAPAGVEKITENEQIENANGGEEDVVGEPELKVGPDISEEVKEETVEEVSEGNLNGSEVAVSPPLNDSTADGTLEKANDTEIAEEDESISGVNVTFNDSVVNDTGFVEDELNGSVVNDTLKESNETGIIEENKSIGEISDESAADSGSELNGSVVNDTLKESNFTVNETLNSSVINSSITNETNIFVSNVSNVTVKVITTRSKIRIGQRVKWVKNVSLSEPESVAVELPEIAKEVIVTKIDDDGDEKNASIKVRTVTGEVIGEIKQDENPGFFEWLRRIFLSFRATLTGLATLGNSGDGAVEIVLEDNATEYVIEYYTDAPSSSEETTDFGKRITITGPDNLNYTDVVAFSFIPESDSGVRIHWIEGDLDVPFDAYDSDSNGKIDYVEWVVPHLSNQTYDIILISNAEHLNANRSFLEDVYEEVRKRDGIFSTIPDTHYLRVRFERNLTLGKDITIFARSSENGRVEVYEKDSDVKIADFGVINTDREYRVLLDSLSAPQDSFDLLVSGGTVEFDYVQDPPLTCGKSLEVSASLTTNLEGVDAGYCLNITQDNIELDCSSFSLNASSSLDTSGTAIMINGRKNITVKNCRIENWQFSINSSESSNITIKDNVLIGNNSNSGKHYLINFNGVNESLISGNNITMRKVGATGESVGIRLNNSLSVDVEYNNITDTDGTEGKSIYIIKNSSDITVRGNRLVDSYNAIEIGESSGSVSPSDINIVGNTMINQGNDAVNILGLSSGDRTRNVTIDSNTINKTGDYFLRISSSGADDILVKNNIIENISLDALKQRWAVYVTSKVFNLTLLNNTLQNSQSGFLSTSFSNVSLIGNMIKDSSFSINYVFSRFGMIQTIGGGSLLLENNTFYNNSPGSYVVALAGYSYVHNIVRGNNFTKSPNSASGSYSIWISRSSGTNINNATLERNYFDDIPSSVVYIDSKERSLAFNNIFNNIGKIGITVTSTPSFSVISNNSFFNWSWQSVGTETSAILLSSSKNATVSNNTMFRSGGGGIGIRAFSTSSDSVIESNNITRADIGIQVDGSFSSSQPIVRNNLISDIFNQTSTTNTHRGAGVYLTDTSAARVESNNISGARIGILSDGYHSSDKPSIVDNLLLNSLEIGAEFRSGADAGTFENNTIKNSPVGIEIDSGSDSHVLNGNIIENVSTGISASGNSIFIEFGRIFSSIVGVNLSNSDSGFLQDIEINATDGPEIIVDGLSDDFDVGGNTILEGKINITISPIKGVSINVNSTPPSAPPGNTSLGTFLEVRNVSSSGIVNFDIDYSESDLSDIESEDEIRVYRFNETLGKWTVITNSTFDSTDNFVSSGNLTEFSTFGVFGPTAVSTSSGGGSTGEGASAEEGGAALTLLPRPSLAIEFCYITTSCSDWGSCIEGESRRTCTDSFECVGDREEPPSVYEESISCSCDPSFQCGDYGECSYVDRVEDVITGEVSLTGSKERTCVDVNACASDITESQSCSSKSSIETNIAGDLLTAISDSGVPVARINLSELEEGRLSVVFVQNESAYPAHCFDARKDADEEMVDCGGSCNECVSQYVIPWLLILLAALILIMLWLIFEYWKDKKRVREKKKTRIFSFLERARKEVYEARKERRKFGEGLRRIVSRFIPKGKASTTSAVPESVPVAKRKRYGKIFAGFVYDLSRKPLELLAGKKIRKLVKEGYREADAGNLSKAMKNYGKIKEIYPILSVGKKRRIRREVFDYYKRIKKEIGWANKKINERNSREISRKVKDYLKRFKRFES